MHRLRETGCNNTQGW